jgi:D-inositol-3-phosphate glycosyltransferase
VTLSPYEGPSVFGFETDTLRRVAAISVHTSPLATLGGRDAGGMNVYVRELACNTGQLGVPVDIFTRRTDPDAPDTIQICDDVTVVNISAGPAAPVDKNQLFDLLPDFANEVALYGLRTGARYDVVHGHYWLSGWVAHLLKRYWATPFVQMFHTTAHMKNAVSPATQRETELRANTERALVTLADSIVAANPDERADLIWRQHAPAEKTCTIPPGVDTSLFRPLHRAVSRIKLGLPDERPIVLFVGRIDPIKGIDVLLEAAALMAGSSNMPLFVFVGGDLDINGAPVGPLEGIAAIAERLGLSAHCRFVGSQPQNELPLYYAAADITAVPSRYESFGLVAVESMACGTPVVASRVGGLTFTVEDGETGVLVPYGEPQALAAGLRSLLVDPDLRLLMGRMGHFSAQRFSWDAVASSVAHLYYRLASGHSAKLCCEEEVFA